MVYYKLMINGLVKPGSMVSCRHNMDYLTIWKSYRCNVDQDIDIVRSGEIMLILKSRRTAKASPLVALLPLASEWEIGAYRVLTPRGVSGWVGAGWVTPII